MKLRDLFDIIKADRQIALGLFVVLVAGMTIIYFARNKKDDEIINKKMLFSDNKGYSNNSNEYYGKNKDNSYYAVESRPIHLQPFDPNTADSTLLLGLGLQPWQVRSIYKYRAAGGVYTRPEDFARLYGLSVKKYRELRPYIRISPDYRPASEVYTSHRTANNSNTQHQSPNTQHQSPNPQYQSPNTQHQSPNTHDATPATVPSGSAAPSYPQKLKPGQTISLNTSDTISLRKVPGIGAHFARKIFRYRERLGGFVSKEQLLEIQDFPESTLPYLNLPASEASNIRKLNINKATSEQLRNHPYISYMMARQIIDYRRLRGTIHDINDLRLLSTFTPEIINKLHPYIEY